MGSSGAAVPIRHPRSGGRCRGKAETEGGVGRQARTSPNRNLSFSAKLALGSPRASGQQQEHGIFNIMGVETMKSFGLSIMAASLAFALAMPAHAGETLDRVMKSKT